MNPLTALPPKARAAIYYATFGIGIALGAIQLGFDTAAQALPTWLVVALKVLPFLVAGFGITAASNTQTATPTLTVATTPDTVAAEVVSRLRDEKGRFIGAPEPRRAADD